MTALAPETLSSWLREHQDLLVVDVRSAAEFESMHIRGSYNVPLPLLSEHTDYLAARLGRRVIPALFLGLAVGAVLGMVRGGGSIVAVPALVYGVGLSPAEAIPTSLLVVGASSLAALAPTVRDGLNWPVIGPGRSFRSCAPKAVAVGLLVGFLTGFTVDWPSILAFAVPPVLGSLVTARLAQQLKESHIRISLAVTIFAVAAWVAVSTTAALIPVA
ncbi:MAG: TSUP family transporter [Arthrobacter sp.]|nr:TSUP family transporter [Arthrobacter sp.]